jgi:hypothetical protein
MFALAAVIGIRYAMNWAERQGVVEKLKMGGDASDKHAGGEPPAPAPGPGPTAPAPTPSPPVAAPTPEAPGGPAPAPPPPAGPTPAPAAPDARALELADNHPADDKTGTPPVQGDKVDKVDKKDDDDDDPDEEALLRDAVPNAEDAVIGEDDAEEAPPPKPGVKKPAPAPAPKPKAPPPKTAAADKPAPAPKVETAVLHITSAPKGAIVRTKSRVLGRTPLNLHFKTGNTYELKLVKRGYTSATRRVAVNNAKDRKVAVTLKKKAAPKKRTSFFRPHR